MKRANLLGFDIDTFTKEEAISYAKSIHGQVVTINPEMINYAEKNAYFANIIKEAELVIPDGIGVQIGLKLNGYNIKRIAGIDFAKSMLQYYKRVALVGAKNEIVNKAKENLSLEYADIDFVYVHDGYFDNDEDIIKDLKESEPQLVLVALGSPKQEEFIYKIKNQLPHTLFIGVGGSFDVWAGAVERAPYIYQKMGLEWLYRTVKEPKRFKRIFPTLPLFMFKVLCKKRG